MPDLKVTRRDGSIRQIAAPAAMTLMEVLRDEGLEIEALCGGCCSCATCHVYIDPGNAGLLPPISEDEALLLEDSENYRAGTSRLSCQIRITDDMDGLEVEIAPAD